MQNFLFQVPGSDQRFHFLTHRHDPEGPLPGRDQGSRRIRKGQHLLQLRIVKLQAVIQHVIQHAGAEGVAGARRLDRRFLQEGRRIDPAAAACRIKKTTKRSCGP